MSNFTLSHSGAQSGRARAHARSAARRGCLLVARSKSRAVLSSAVGWVSPTEGDLSVTAAEATKRWVTTGNAVIKSQDGSWYTAVKVRKVARAGEFSVLGTPKRRQKARASDEHDH